MSEVSAGAALVRSSASGLEVLLIRIRSGGYELPKGHLEEDETPEQAAVRELKEETGLVSEALVGELLGTLAYAFETGSVVIQKRVQYYRCISGESGVLTFGKVPPRTKELRWIKQADVPELLLVSEELRPILAKAFGIPSSPPRRGLSGTMG